MTQVPMAVADLTPSSSLKCLTHARSRFSPKLSGLRRYLRLLFENINNFEALSAELVNSLIVTGATDTVSIITGTGSDEVNSYGVNVAITTGDGDDVVVKYTGGGTIDTGSGNDTVDLLNMGQITVIGAGDDTIKIRSHFDTIQGGAGTDTLIILENWIYSDVTVSLKIRQCTVTFLASSVKLSYVCERS